jgi:hypothetical protein
MMALGSAFQPNGFGSGLCAAAKRWMVLQGDDGGEHASFEPALGELGEHGLDGAQPGA